MKTSLFKNLLCGCAGLFAFVPISAQESINAGGGQAGSAAGSVSYSIGQTFYTEDKGTDGSLTKGVQHAYEIFTVSVKEEAIDLKLSVFPNPTADFLTIQKADLNTGSLSYQLIDMQGKLLRSGPINGLQTDINMLGFTPAVYFITVRNEKNQIIQNFKIIKK